MAATNFNVYFYNFTKKVNSTRTPVNGTEGLFWEVHTCYLRSPSSIIAPVLEMSFDRNQYGGDGGTYNENIGEAVLEYNYAYIPRFNRYYFINNISWNNGIFILNLECDVLGTYKEDIGNYTGFILRCSDNNNTWLVDEHKYISGTSTKTMPTTAILGDTLYYIVGTSFGCDAVSSGLTYLAGTADNIKTILNDIMNREFCYGREAPGQPTADEFVYLNPQSAIQSVTTIPFQPTVITGQDLYLNGYGFAVNASVLTNPLIEVGTFTIDIPKHPDSGTYHYYNYPPYSDYTLILPCVGSCQLSAYDLADKQSIKLRVTADAISGTIAYRVTTTSARLGIYTGACGAGGGIASTFSTGATAISSAIQQGVTGGLGGVIQAVSGAALFGLASATTGVGAMMTPVMAGLTMINGVTGLASGITSTANAALSAVRSAAASSSNKTMATMSGGTRAQPTKYASLELSYRTLSGGDDKTLGNPWGQKGKIKDHKGYMLISAPSVDINGTAAEMTAVNKFLSSGFYYEEDVTQQ